VGVLSGERVDLVRGILRALARDRLEFVAFSRERAEYASDLVAIDAVVETERVSMTDCERLRGAASRACASVSVAPVPTSRSSCAHLG
jgi:hypothetical protein